MAAAAAAAAASGDAARLVREREDAVWVLYKLDGGIDHVLLDEAPGHRAGAMGSLRALTADFFGGPSSAARSRTLFAVGDAKQSIFSFQGAGPERFAVEAQAFERRVPGCRRRLRKVALLESWRSTPEILDFVDAVFDDPRRSPVCLASEPTAPPLRHTGDARPGRLRRSVAARERATKARRWMSGRRSTPQPATTRTAAWPSASPREIASWSPRRAGRRQGQRRAAPCGYGDVLILVRRRNALFDEIIRALKRAGVPVAGADRLKLSEHGAFEDLLALGRFVLLSAGRPDPCRPAARPVLRVRRGEPVRARPRPRRRAVGRAAAPRRRAAGLARGARLPRLGARGGARPRPSTSTAACWAVSTARAAPCASACSRAWAREARARDRRLPRRGAGGRGARRARSRTADRRARRQRDRDQARGGGRRRRRGGEVRVMTVHGAKGLEAPMVILPDTTSRARTQRRRRARRPRTAASCGRRGQARTARPRAEARGRALKPSSDEVPRLLYVALTRARDRLVVCGVKRASSSVRGSWCDLIERGLRQRSTSRVDPAARIGGEVRRFGADPIQGSGAPTARRWQAACPAGSARRPRARATGGPSLPSDRYERAHVAAVSPLAAARGLGRWRRGA